MLEQIWQKTRFESGYQYSKHPTHIWVGAAVDEESAEQGHYIGILWWIESEHGNRPDINLFGWEAYHTKQKQTGNLASKGEVAKKAVNSILVQEGYAPMTLEPLVTDETLTTYMEEEVGLALCSYTKRDQVELEWDSMVPESAHIRNAEEIANLAFAAFAKTFLPDNQAQSVIEVMHKTCRQAENSMVKGSAEGFFFGDAEEVVKHPGIRVTIRCEKNIDPIGESVLKEVTVSES